MAGPRTSTCTFVRALSDFKRRMRPRRRKDGDETDRNHFWVRSGADLRDLIEVSHIAQNPPGLLAKKEFAKEGHTKWGQKEVRMEGRMEGWKEGRKERVEATEGRGKV